MGDLKSPETFQVPKKLFWQDPLRLIIVIGAVLGFGGSMLEAQYSIASVISWVGLSMAIAGGIAMTIRKNSGRHR